jgi:regulatory protein
VGAGFDEPDVDGALIDLEAAGLVEDARFAFELVRHQAGRRLAGDRAIREALRAKGVSPDVVEEAVQAAGDEAARAFELAERRARRLSHLPPESAYRRLLGLLTRRGYPFEIAREACESALREAMARVPDEESPSD